MSFEISDIWITIGKTVGLLIGTFITIKLIKLLMSKSITRILKLRDSIQEE